eukprot:TRINITY_DN2900_c0_g1_i3.p1 TRINITY_DN2900_c0_g1~~TRINITY_DN2900_c0_g1_i3.p1  ORF type:complete len:218 (-),score=95.19 TRINITY_DN2900_c0_g1_i3:125-778(-)
MNRDAKEHTDLEISVVVEHSTSSDGEVHQNSKATEKKAMDSTPTDAEEEGVVDVVLDGEDEEEENEKENENENENEDEDEEEEEEQDEEDEEEEEEQDEEEDEEEEDEEEQDEEDEEEEEEQDEEEEEEEEDEEDETQAKSPRVAVVVGDDAAPSDAAKDGKGAQKKSKAPAKKLTRKDFKASAKSALPLASSSHMPALPLSRVKKIMKQDPVRVGV